MKFFIDTKFIDKSIDGFDLDLISIGLVSETGKEFYMISNEFDLDHVWNKQDDGLFCFRDNVLKSIWEFLEKKDDFISRKDIYHFSLKGKTYDLKRLKYLIDKYGNSNEEIKEAIVKFTHPLKFSDNLETQDICLIEDNKDITCYPGFNITNKEEQSVFYGYESENDWDLLCSLFGGLKGIPSGYSIKCIDLIDDIHDNYNLILKHNLEFVNGVFKDIEIDGEISDLTSFYNRKNHTYGWVYDVLFEKENCNSALDGALWNWTLYRFLNYMKINN